MTDALVAVLVDDREELVPSWRAVELIRSGRGVLVDQTEAAAHALLDCHGERVRQQLAVVSGAEGGPTMGLRDAIRFEPRGGER